MRCLWKGGGLPWSVRRGSGERSSEAGPPTEVHAQMPDAAHSCSVRPTTSQIVSATGRPKGSARDGHPASAAIQYPVAPGAAVSLASS